MKLSAMSNRVKRQQQKRLSSRAVARLAHFDAGIPKPVTMAVLAVLAKVITKELAAGGRFELRDIGSFYTKGRFGRGARKTARYAYHVRFKASKQLKTAIWAVRKPQEKA